MNIKEIINNIDLKDIPLLMNALEMRALGLVKEGVYGTAIYKSRVKKDGSITIPEVEMEALGLEEGDVVQVVMRKVDK